MMTQLILGMVLMLPVATTTAEQGLPDPTRPFEFNVEPEMVIVEQDSREENVTWRLNGIRIGENQRSAILNGRVVGVGDEVRGARVLEIEPAWIVIRHENQRIRVELLDVDIKRHRQAMTDEKQKDTNQMVPK